MNIKTVLILLTVSLFPANLIAQSFWLHKQIVSQGAGGIPAIAGVSPTDFFWAHGVDFEGVSTDYGATWSYILVDSPKYHLRLYSFKCSVHPSRSLILVGCNDHNVGHLIRSTDGGVTWLDTAIGSYAKGTAGRCIAAMAARDSTHIAMLVGDTLTYLADYLLLSTDAGRTWTSESAPRFHSYDPGGMPGSPIMAFFGDSSIVVAHNALFEDSSTIYRTTNLGRSWEKVYRATSTLTKFAFTSPNTGFVSGVDPYDSQRATIDRTTDGGATWHVALSKIIVPISTSYFGNSAGLRSIAFADSSHGIACGGEGLVLRTIDGGASWQEMRSDYTFDASSADLLTDVAFPDTAHAMIASSDGAVLIYQPEGLLDLPNITYPKFTPFMVGRTFDVTWDPVPNATRYSVSLTTGGYPDSNTTMVISDSVVSTNSFRMTDLVDTAPPPTNGGRYYDLYVQAFNATNRSNVAHRIFLVDHDSATGAVVLRPQIAERLEVYPNPATDRLFFNGFVAGCTITDAIGRRWDCPEFERQIDISKLPAGVYFLHAGTQVARFIKQ